MNDSNYWGPPRHDLPMTHATPNPTDSYHGPGGGANPAGSYHAPAIGSGQGAWSGAGSAYAAVASRGPSKRSIPLAVVLAFLFGPLGLFYASLLNGIAALIVLPFAVRYLAFAVALVLRGGMDMVYTVAVPILWCVAVPWAVISVRVRNARIDRADAGSKQ
jgi:hypothetical protein